MVTCNEYEYYLSKTTSCGCTECQTSGEITIDGTVVTMVNGQEELVLPDVALMVDNQSMWARRGKFTWTGAPTEDYVAIRYETQGNGDTTFLSTVTTVQVIPGLHYYQVPIVLTLRPEPVVVDAKQGALLEVGGSSSMIPAARVSIPPSAVVDETGNIIEGDVNVFVTFSDPRVEDGLATAPGEFTFEDEEGLVRELQTFGVVGLEVQTSSGQSAYISGQSEFSIDTTTLGIPLNDAGEPDALLWTLDPVTGQWVESGPLVNEDGKRKKRQTAGASGSSEFPPNVPYINIDKPLLRDRQCYVSVFVYSNRNMTEGFPGQTVKIYTKDLTGTTYLGQSSGRTGSDGKICLLLACGLTHELVVYSGVWACRLRVAPPPSWVHFSEHPQWKSRVFCIP